MRIPGLTFIILPLICWILYLNSDFIIQGYYNNPPMFIISSILLYLFLGLLELLIFRVRPYKTDKEIFESAIIFIPFFIIYRVLKYINEKLTVKI